MTKGKASDLLPGRELDALVAEKILGCRVLWQYATTHGPYCGCECGEDGNFRFEIGPHSAPNKFDENLYDYSTSFDAASPVLSFLTAQGRNLDIGYRRSSRDGAEGYWIATLGFAGASGEALTVYGETPAHAVCLLALEVAARTKGKL